MNYLKLRQIGCSQIKCFNIFIEYKGFKDIKGSDKIILNMSDFP